MECVECVYGDGADADDEWRDCRGCRRGVLFWCGTTTDDDDDWDDDDDVYVEWW